MKHNKITLISVILLSLLLNNCGFTPMYKIGAGGIALDRVSIEFKSGVTYEVKDELQIMIGTSQSDADYNVIINVKEELVPVIVNTNGTVSKYQIDIAIFFDVIDKNNVTLLSDVSLGFAQYDVQVSEIENEELRKTMLRSATRDAARLMITKIQSKISLQNDN